ncbi:haloacid dehalogenase [Primorskyibacter flagellatus]|uniref:(S)-2-haloacid dehalogenase n=1 Tax=Primorskyibacter flagellatus TaxID=1387277 RepID=A0A917AAV0_9RHOB|nr:haloacid dehalogenase type II [Primorskyibacter flagellatus]GGE35882.1 haloacid dehalogenase [Primorskyibacter flagellatus]
MPLKACIFDAYGTLFDVSAAAREAAGEPGRERLASVWPALAEDWRRKQLEYSWLRAITGAHCDFWQVTQDGLDWALEAQGLTDPALRDRLLQLYRELSAYPEVPAMLKALRTQGRRTGILSNGSEGMLADAVRSAGIGDLLDVVLSVDRVGVFKPASRVYDLVGQALSLDPGEILFVSSNGWDAASARSYGFSTAWVNRQGVPMDRLPGQPDYVLSDLSGIPDIED